MLTTEVCKNMKAYYKNIKGPFLSEKITYLEKESQVGLDKGTDCNSSNISPLEESTKTEVSNLLENKSILDDVQEYNLEKFPGLKSIFHQSVETLEKKLSDIYREINELKKLYGYDDNLGFSNVPINSEIGVNTDKYVKYLNLKNNSNLFNETYIKYLSFLNNSNFYIIKEELLAEISKDSLFYFNKITISTSKDGENLLVINSDLLKNN